jgi:hypothetical protein
MLVFAHHFVGEDPGGNNGKNKKGDYSIEGPPVEIHMLISLKARKNKWIQVIFMERIKNCL